MKQEPEQKDVKGSVEGITDSIDTVTISDDDDGMYIFTKSMLVS